MITNVEQFLLWEQSTRDTIDFKKIYVDIAKDLIAGLILSEIVFWHLPSRDGTSKLRVEHNGILWIAVPRYEWWNRTRISPKQADRALALLENQGLIARDLFKFNGDPTTHIALVWERFLPQLYAVIESPPENPYSPKVNNGIPKRSITESTFGETPVTENTTEIKVSGEKFSPIENPLTGDPITPGMIYGGIREIPLDPKAKHGDPESPGKRSSKDPDFPEIGRSIFRVLEAHGIRDVTTLSDNQLELLNQEVFGPRGKFPSPADEQAANPEAWKDFLDAIDEMPAWDKRFNEGKERLTPSKVIEFIRGYHWLGGWLEFRPENVEEDVYTPQPLDHYDPQEEWLR